MFRAMLCGVVLFAQAPLQFSEVLRFTLDESPEQIVRGMGQPVLVNDADPAFRTWYFQTDVLDKHDHSHVLLFRKSSNQLISVTRNYHLPVHVDALFPPTKSSFHHCPQISVRVREFSGERVLIAMGVAKPGQPTTQLIAIRRSALRIFFPWLQASLTASTELNTH